MTLHVTDTDIAIGDPNDVDCCPLARAAQRAFPNEPVVTCGFYYIRVGEEKYTLPPEALAFQRKLFRREKVEPCSFNLEKGWGGF